MNADFIYKNSTLLHGDCLSKLDTLEESSIDTVITDPPYHIGFMNKEWEKNGVAFDPGTWKKVLRVAKPGAFLLAFGGTRTFHRLACAIEDAGWELRDCLCWEYASGFPKSLDISKQLDKKAGAERKTIGVKQNTYDGAKRDPAKHGNPADQSNIGKWGLNQTPHGMPLTAPATDAAKEWSGWGTALKPAWEPIIVAMKPLDGTFINNAIKHGVAGLNIGECRIGYQSESDKNSATPQGKCTSKEVSAIGAEPDAGRELERVEFERPKQTGRWPSNLLLSHHEDCTLIGHRKVKNKSGSVSGNETSHTGDENTTCYGEYARIPFQKYGEKGFEEMEHWECHVDCPVRLLDGQSGTVSFGKKSEGYNYSGKEYDVEGFVGKCKPKAPSNYGDSGGASRFFYVSKVSKKERNAGLPEGMQNTHPTVKPIQLMEYLCKLTETPTKGTVLDPFMGSGSTGIACARTGRHFIGIELEEESFEISKLRIQHAYKNKNTKKPRDLFGDDND